MQTTSQDDCAFTMSSGELRRREKAFDRLGVSLIIAFGISSADLFAGHASIVIVAIGCLATLFVASHVWLAVGNRRYARTNWSIGRTTLTRTDSRSSRQIQLDSIRLVQAKRTTVGAIREIRLGLDDGSAVYVNGLEDAESFWDCLASRTAGASRAFLREPIDYDHPLFYLALGCALGASIGVIVRIGVSVPQVNGFWVYAALAVYALAVSVYWARAKPISGRYGNRAVTWDYAVSAVAFICSVGSTIAAAAL